MTTWVRTVNTRLTSRPTRRSTEPLTCRRLRSDASPSPDPACSRSPSVTASPSSAVAVPEPQRVRRPADQPPVTGTHASATLLVHPDLHRPDGEAAGVAGHDVTGAQPHRLRILERRRR